MARLHLIRRRLRRLGEIDNYHRALLAEAVASLLVARLVLVFVSFQRIARWLGAFVPPTDPRAVQAKVHVEQDAPLAREIGWAVTRAARYVPFKAVCLPQAMAARVMLNRRGVKSVMHFGAARGDNRNEAKPFEAHAWLDAVGVEVTGYPVMGEFTEIACFV
jgi:hypothetical protein